MKKSIIYAAILILAILGFYFFVGFNTATTETVDLYYYNPELDTDVEDGAILCSDQGLVSVEREIENTTDVIGDTIRLLIKGELTEEEMNEGIQTEFPLEGFELESYTLNDGVLTLNFNDPNFASSGGSCRVGILSWQIIETALQFPEVEEVEATPEGVLQP